MDSNGQLFSLKWNNYLSHIMDAFESLRSEENLVDVTLSCEGYKIKAHKMLLSACSSYFKDLFKDNPCQHPIVVFRNVRYNDLRALIDFIYQGEVNIMQDQLASFLATAKLLEVKGLADNNFDSAFEKTEYQDLESFEEENSENIDDDDVDDDENLSDSLQYAQSNYSNENASCPLTIIPISKSISDVSEVSNFKRKKKMDNDEESFSKRAFSQNSKQQQSQKISSAEIPSLSFKCKQSVEIFPVSTIKTEKVEDLYNSETSFGSRDVARIDPNEYVEIHPSNVEQKLSKISKTVVDENYSKKHLELNHLLSKSTLRATDSEMQQDSLQGHWLSSLNSSGDGSESSTNENTVTNASKKPEAISADNLQQRHRYVCSICGATYKHLRNLRAHCHLHYGKTRCNLCNKVLCNISYFKKHLQQQHGLLTAKKTDSKNLSSTSVALNS